jgi:phospholipase C
MPSRREFLKTIAFLSGAGGLGGALGETIRRALAIDPEPGSSFLDAEHVVILMQENRSFDHCFGTLAGVRGFNDPRAIMLPNRNPIWVQTNKAGESYAPFRLNIRETHSTWTGSLPHDRADQVDARNDGNHDQWLDAKRPGSKKYGAMPLTLGYCTRDDIPFHYALADAFTICDQHFCSSLTPTSPNRLYFWTGTVREKPSPDSPACVRNRQAEREHSPAWITFPERLEDHGISWKIYQNEVTQRSGFTEEQDAWLSNFGDNPMEYFAQYHGKFAKGHRDYLAKQVADIAAQTDAMKTRLAGKRLSAKDTAALQKHLKTLTADLIDAEVERNKWSRENFEKLPERERNLHEKAFATNAGDPAYRELIDLAYQDGGVERHMPVPKGDILHQFRQDVQTGKLPTVSWLVAPAKLSDHPSCPWFGEWYLSETINILTQNPQIWKKTIFILTYDENDGYFDHVPPFVAPHPRRPETGFASKGIDTSVEYVELEQERRLKLSGPREAPIGLGYRVPMIVASPWSRGGCVCSQVFDHTSVLQFLEEFLTRKTGKPVEETNITAWRRTVCGDLTSIFRQAPPQKTAGPSFLTRDSFFEQIERAKYQPPPSGYTLLSDNAIEQIRQNPARSPWLPRQERGVRPSCALPYELYVDGSLSADRSQFTIRFAVGNQRFGARSAGCPFTVYAITGNGRQIIRNYAVAAGERLEDSWDIRDFAHGNYQLRAYGPNGFFREFIGTADDPPVELRLAYTLEGDVRMLSTYRGTRESEIEIADRSYKTGTLKKSVKPGTTATIAVGTQRSFRWYDLSVRLESIRQFEQRFAGRVETGQWGFSDPAMGGAVG